MNFLKKCKPLLFILLAILAFTPFLHIHSLESEVDHPCFVCSTIHSGFIVPAVAGYLVLFSALASVFVFIINFKQSQVFYSFFLRAPPAQA